MEILSLVNEIFTMVETPANILALISMALFVIHFSMKWKDNDSIIKASTILLASMLICTIVDSLTGSTEIQKYTEMAKFVLLLALIVVMLIIGFQSFSYLYKNRRKDAKS